jgi:hypothetical protein
LLLLSQARQNGFPNSAFNQQCGEALLQRTLAAPKMARLVLLEFCVACLRFASYAFLPMAFPVWLRCPLQTGKRKCAFSSNFQFAMLAFIGTDSAESIRSAN